MRAARVWGAGGREVKRMFWPPTPSAWVKGVGGQNMRGGHAEERPEWFGTAAWTHA